MQKIRIAFKIGALECARPAAITDYCNDRFNQVQIDYDDADVAKLQSHVSDAIRNIQPVIKNVEFTTLERMGRCIRLLTDVVVKIDNPRDFNRAR